MRTFFVSTALLFLTVFISSSGALESLPNSPCAVQCGNVLGSTTGSDIVCNNADFTGTPAGVTFQSCITCQLGSTYVDPVTKETDLQWGLYNLRFAISWCLFGYPNNTAVGDTPCITSTACGPLQNAIEFDSLSTVASEYGYCALFTAVSVPKCSACLSVQSTQFYLLNFMTALNGACQQQPSAGHTLSLQGSLFSMTPTNITNPSPTPGSTFTPSSSKFSLGAKVGVAVAGALLLLGILGFCVVWRGKRRRRALLQKHQQDTGYSVFMAQEQQRQSVLSVPHHMSQPTSAVSGRGPAFFDSPMSQRPLVSNVPWHSGRNGDDTPMSAVDEKPAYFSPYSSHYGSPVSATDGIRNFSQWPVVDRKGSVGSYSGYTAYPARSRSIEKKEPQGGNFELQNVAPVVVLKHPGHGRQGSSRSQSQRSQRSQLSVALTEEDLQRGDAV